MLYLSPLLKAKARIQRLASLSNRLDALCRQHPWLAIPLLPPHLALRWLSRRQYQQLTRLGYFPTRR